MYDNTLCFSVNPWKRIASNVLDAKVGNNASVIVLTMICIHGHDLRADNSKLLNKPLRPCTRIMRHTKMNGVRILREFADSDKMYVM